MYHLLLPVMLFQALSNILSPSSDSLAIWFSLGNSSVKANSISLLYSQKKTTNSIGHLYKEKSEGPYWPFI